MKAYDATIVLESLAICGLDGNLEREFSALSLEFPDRPQSANAIIQMKAYDVTIVLESLATCGLDGNLEREFSAFSFALFGGVRLAIASANKNRTKLSRLSAPLTARNKPACN